MIKPVPQKEVTIAHAIGNGVRVIYFYSTEDAVTEFYCFGLVERWDQQPDHYRLTVDARYDFDDVVRYIESYG